MARGANYGLIEDYVNRIEQNTLTICQIETVKGVRNARAIAETDGVDMIFIGRNDLAADAGHILELDHPQVNALVDEVVKAVRTAGKKVGTVPSAGRSWTQLLDEGFDMVLSSSDMSILRSTGQAEVEAYKAHRNGSASSQFAR